MSALENSTRFYEHTDARPFLLRPETQKPRSRSPMTGGSEPDRIGLAGGGDGGRIPDALGPVSLYVEMLGTPERDFPLPDITGRCERRSRSSKGLIYTTHGTPPYRAKRPLI